MTCAAVAMWRVPYFRGTSPEIRRLYAAMHVNIRHLLPPRGPDGDNPRPNVHHLAFHALFLTTILLAVAFRTIQS